ncbi:KUP/HAK/KT family potassium transporter [Opitutus sp. ER46]|uniref:potassium transporter Kup n=1 Tax=Opitutus sp. ER46 TaxID=2161864 RepID=UPI000D2FBC23|nr:KUP/HAK/KT family potassium transporter [Opitutus sp. ER46]PTX99005.1 potassium transporter [Opitutus sp. ER46]
MSHQPTPLSRGAQIALSIGALGVVFGDIGTSPLYALNETLRTLPPVERIEGVLGALSLVFWALTFEVSFKYLGFIMRADNRGEGGIFALLALSHTDRSPTSRTGSWFTLLILFGAALLYGDGVITPAISVLGAVEGLKDIDSHIGPAVPLIACIILGALFWVQHKGTRIIGRLFGPVMLVWFAALAVLGVWNLVQQPVVLHALNPLHGLRLLATHPLHATKLLGVVILAITGAEALYADMGHFGRKAIARAWYFGAFPGLALCYFGQGAYVLLHPEATENPFFALAGHGAGRYVLILLSTMAAIVASQALISGTYSLTRQAIQLGYFPRLQVRHTNAELVGQIYLPFVNTTLAILTIAVVLYFQTVERLITAYGVAVTGTMVVTTLAFYRVTRMRWKWKLWHALPLCAVFFLFDLGFFVSNLHKFVEGGWLPLAIALGVLAVMHTWKTGRAEIYQRVYGNNVTETELTSIARSKHVTRVSGAAVFMVGSPTGTPIALLHHVKANRALHQTVVLLSIATEEVPSVPEAEQLTLYEIGEGIWRAVGHYGYMQSPDVSALMEQVRGRGVDINPTAATYFFNREMIISGGSARMWEWQKSLYAFLSRNARPAKDYYRITPSQIIEIGLPLQL